MTAACDAHRKFLRSRFCHTQHIMQPPGWARARARGNRPSALNADGRLAQERWLISTLRCDSESMGSADDLWRMQCGRLDMLYHLFQFILRPGRGEVRYPVSTYPLFYPRPSRLTR